MDKKIKAGLVFASALVIGRTVFAALNAKETKEEKTEDLVVNVWNDIKDDVVRTLQLKKEPQIMFDKDNKNDAIMYVNHTISSTGTLFDRVVTGTTTDYIIHVDAKTVADTIDIYNKGAFYLAFDLPKMLIAQLLYHESRHIWQAEKDFYIGQHYNPIHFSLEGHGEKPQEKDANAFAYSMAKTNREKVLATMQTKMQENAGKIIANDDSKERLAFIKEFNPILKWVC